MLSLKIEEKNKKDSMNTKKVYIGFGTAIM